MPVNSNDLDRRCIFKFWVNFGQLLRIVLLILLSMRERFRKNLRIRAKFRPGTKKILSSIYSSNWNYILTYEWIAFSHFSSWILFSQSYHSRSEKLLCTKYSNFSSLALLQCKMTFKFLSLALLEDFKDNRKVQTSNWSHRQSDTTRWSSTPKILMKKIFEF